MHILINNHAGHPFQVQLSRWSFINILTGKDLLDRFVYVYAECSFVGLYTGQALAHEIISWLRERAFLLFGVYNISYDRKGRAVQGDFLFTHIRSC